MFVCRMSVSADDARAKVIACEALDDKQKAKMLLLINTEPDRPLLVLTGVPDFLLGRVLSLYLERMTAGTTPAHAIALYFHASSALRLLLVTFHIGLQHLRLKVLKQTPLQVAKIRWETSNRYNCIAVSENLIYHMSVHPMLVACSLVVSTQRF